MRRMAKVVAVVALMLCMTLTGSLAVILDSDSAFASADDGDWRNREVDPALWEDGPELEGSPMDTPRLGDPLIIINVSYIPGHLQSRQEGEIVIELFEEWAPITVANMIKHVENDLYDGIFFHRVIDDFVTQAGDPECTTLGIYPATNLACGSGGTGETIPIEFNENLSHVDGAIGMARDTDPDSADSQWYIAETEAHSLDKENSSSGGYATFGVVRDGMSHVRAIALTPTSDDPTGLPFLQNPLSSAGRPFYEVHIASISMLGVVGEDSTPEPNDMNSSMEPMSEAEGFFLVMVAVLGLVGTFLVLAMVSTAIVRSNRGEEVFQFTIENTFKSFFRYGLFWPLLVVVCVYQIINLINQPSSGGLGDFGALIICGLWLIGILVCIISWIVQLSTTAAVQFSYASSFAEYEAARKPQ